jgi:hypothetical protein
MEVKKFTLFEVAKILRNHHLNKLNYKDYNKFTQDDFDGVEYVRVNNKTRPKDLVGKSSRVSKMITAISPKGKEIVFDGVTDICEALDIKAKNYWRKMAENQGYTIVSVEEVAKLI